jgi:hypothetical protein
MLVTIVRMREVCPASSYPNLEHPRKRSRDSDHVLCSSLSFMATIGYIHGCCQCSHPHLISSQEPAFTARTQNSTTIRNHLLVPCSCLFGQWDGKLHQDRREILEATGLGADRLEDTAGEYCLAMFLWHASDSRSRSLRLSRLRSWLHVCSSCRQMLEQRSEPNDEMG